MFFSLINHWIWRNILRNWEQNSTFHEDFLKVIIYIISWNSGFYYVCLDNCQESIVLENTLSYAKRELNVLIFFFMNSLMKAEDCVSISTSREFCWNKKIFTCYFPCTYLRRCNNDASEFTFQNSSYFALEKFHSSKISIFQCLVCSWGILSL